MSTRLRCPPESLPTGRFKSSCKSNILDNSESLFSKSAPVIPYKAARFSRLDFTDKGLSKTEF